jgi:hypothetical protein
LIKGTASAVPQLQLEEWALALRYALLSSPANSKSPEQRSTIGLTVAAWALGLLALVPLGLIFGLWFLVPNDPSLSPGVAVLSKLKPMAIFVLAMALLLIASRRCFTLQDRRSQLD